MVSVPYLTIALSYHAIAFFEKKACVSRKKNLEKFFALIFFGIKFQLPLPNSYQESPFIKFLFFSFLSKTISLSAVACCLYCFKKFNDSCINQIIFSNLKKLFSHCFSTHSTNYLTNFVRTQKSFDTFTSLISK